MIPSEKIEVSSKEEIGEAIRQWADVLEPGDSLRLQFIDGGCYAGGALLEAEENDITVVTGIYFKGSTDDQGVEFRVELEDGLRIDTEVYELEGSDKSSRENMAQLFESGGKFRADNAPRVKMFLESPVARKLREDAARIEKVWEKAVESGNTVKVTRILTQTKVVASKKAKLRRAELEAPTSMRVA
jgi:hypothetical protein